MAKTTAERIAQIVSQAIITAGKSKSSVAEATGIPYSTLGRKLLGRTEFTITDLITIAEALEIHPSRLIPSDFLAGTAAA